MNNNLEYKIKWPDLVLADFVYCYSSLDHIQQTTEGIIVPNGKIDLLFCKTKEGKISVVLMGLETKPKPMPQHHITSFYSISFHPPALEYILKESIATFVNSGKEMPNDYWDFGADDLDNFESFCQKASEKIKTLLPEKPDGRKLKLFRFISETNGEINVTELSEKIGWNSRQINRYFTRHLGISLKYYCNILRFQASLHHIKDGQLFPELNFTDQSHFIKEIKKLSGVSPKELFKNQKDRFLQFLVYHAK